jgi:hypothetical protein
MFAPHFSVFPFNADWRQGNLILHPALSSICEQWVWFLGDWFLEKSRNHAFSLCYERKQSVYADFLKIGWAGGTFNRGRTMA